MAAASKRITRKQIRQPDWFQTTTEMAFEFYEGHRGKVYIGAAAIVVMLLGFWGLQIFKDRQDAAASHDFANAMILFQSQKYKEAIPAFQNVEAYRWSHYAIIAHLYEANSYFELNDIDKGISAIQRFVTATKPDSLYRQLGLVALATAEEKKNDCKAAVEHYAEAEIINAALKDNALLGKARCAAQLGNIQVAIASYKEYLKNHPEASVALQIAELEAKAAVPTPVK
jgi:hypothetical protein